MPSSPCSTRRRFRSTRVPVKFLAVPRLAAVPEGRELLALGVVRVAPERLVRLRVVEAERGKRPSSARCEVPIVGKTVMCRRSAVIDVSRPGGWFVEVFHGRGRRSDERDCAGVPRRPNEAWWTGSRGAVLAGVVVAVAVALVAWCPTIAVRSVVSSQLTPTFTSLAPGSPSARWTDWVDRSRRRRRSARSVAATPFTVTVKLSGTLSRPVRRGRPS